MWLYFSAAVLLLGAEFSAARGRMHDPRGGWGIQDGAPPGSRAKLASVLAASTVPGYAGSHDSERAVRDAAVTPAARAAAATLSTAAPTAAARAQTRSRTSTRAAALKVGRGVVLAEAQATRLAATALVEAGRTAAAADRYVKRNPWTSVLLAAAAGLTAAAVARRNVGER
jgi:membrane protein